ncbi:MAG TPA: hypothetical protein PKI15_11215, partial [Candidatus Cloacimonadota bacterium]|nr:hypothetical protein [Candidatus Cloacimonadota bacterium]
LGAITCRRFGTQQPITAPVIRQIDNSKYEDQKFTGMPVGSILFYAYCIVNEYGERSNPSPQVVCDTAQWFVKGELLDSEYIYSDLNTGSVKSVSVECAIPVTTEAKRIELYRTSAEYHEGSMPLEPFKLVLSQDISGERDSITLLDSSFYSPMAIDYENDVAPAGDDIVLESGTVFIANAVADKTFAVPVTKVWKITLNNANSLNYINRWFAIDIRDDVAHAISGLSALDYFPGLTMTAITGAKYRFIDTDMITPLTAYIGKGNGSVFSTLTHLTAPTTVKYWGLTYIQIPYLQANSEKVIYLIEATSNITSGTYGYPPIALTSSNYVTFHDLILGNPVRDEKCILSVGNIRQDVPVINGWQSDEGNKANAMFVTDWADGLVEHGEPSLGIEIFEEMHSSPLYS